ncbi:Fe-S cluster assembly protein SufD [Blattabacterium sp. (Blaberus giganteus)]|uniref:Fe-S cluster assembly protein SufD n=1 Tax=Blattabacterium sp. (Blaberus giganteus) TaxID=1186051 RepID=UPI00025F7087|nr:Fe-S cluster assembly protein SufD [Blattabacterium sp. (Blaberus giganteus)]AFJ91023.1 FeS assembly protein [Blattabacterium sp. (Blaberus giganteus)]
MQLKEKITLLINNFKKKENSYISFLQQQHTDFFHKKGFPYSINEEWKNTDIESIINQDYDLIYNNVKIESIEREKVEELTFLKKEKSLILIFIDGKYNPDLSYVHAENIILSNIASLKDNEIRNFYGKLSCKYDAFYTLNTIFSKDGAYIYIPNNVILENPIEILHISTGIESKIMLNNRNLIVIGEHSSVKIIEHYKCLRKHFAFINSVSEIYAMDCSVIDYYKIQNDLVETSIIDNTFLKQKNNSKCTVYTFSLQGNFIRNNLNFYSNGKKTYSYLYGISILSGKQLVDHHTLIDHLCSDSYSFQLYKNILCEKSKGIFNGKIIVNEFIKEINAFQKNHNIILSNEACIYTKPQLKIYSEYVKCSHGCTVGNIQESELFYLQSRGISEKKAKMLLLFSFLEEMLVPIHIFELKKFIHKKIREKLNKHL